jgi:hypothetical protein
MESKSVSKYIFDFAEEVAKKSKWVEIDDYKVEKLARQIQKTEFKPLGYPEVFSDIDSLYMRKAILIGSEILASSVNYCYWYGRSDFKPNNIGANLMYSLLYESFDEFSLKDVPEVFYQKMVLNRLPLLEERNKHIKECSSEKIVGGFFSISNISSSYGDDINFCESDIIDKLIRLDEKENGADDAVRLLMEKFPGFASDVFSKRAILCISLLNRRIGMFKNSINDLPIPADYQIPKMLRWKGCLIYHPSLENKIEEDELIQKGSLEELEIRASSIVVCKMISKISGVSQSDIDAWLWGNRKECNEKFHLTVTTDY